MDAIFMSSAAAEKSVYPNKHVKNRCGANFISNPNGNLANRSFIHGGDLLFAAPFSYQPLMNPLMHQINYQQQQPPLLPLPLPNKQPLYSSVPNRTRSLSSNVKYNTNNDQSLTPKRSKSKKLQNKPFVMASAKVAKDLDSLSSSIFTLSPPPSSLPLPSFSLRPKLSCNAQAASLDDGTATHNIRRLL